MDRPRIVSRDEGLDERKHHLANEKRLTRLYEQLAAERRRLPWVKWRRATSSTAPTAASHSPTSSTAAAS